MEFNSQGRGLRAFAVFDDIENTSDVANGCIFRLYSPPTPSLADRLPPADAELILSYRQSILDMIFTSVSIAGEDATGEEYNDRAELQEKLTIYLEAYTILCSEWQYIVNGTRTALYASFSSVLNGIADVFSIEATRSRLLNSAFFSARKSSRKAHLLRRASNATTLSKTSTKLSRAPSTRSEDLRGGGMRRTARTLSLMRRIWMTPRTTGTVRLSRRRSRRPRGRERGRRRRRRRRTSTSPLYPLLRLTHLFLSPPPHLLC